jgi:GNAT superfamily N-acetyltransferase
VNSADALLFVAEHDGAWVAQGRLEWEHGVLVLRGMQVLEPLRRQGIGALLLQALVEPIRSVACYCVPYRHLVDFYARVGFLEVHPESGPPFLSRRVLEYRAHRGLDVTLMMRPATA